MKTPACSVLVLTLLISGSVFAQGPGTFDLSAYSQFLSDHQNLERAQLLSMHPAGLFALHAPPPGSPAYLDAIDSKYALTPYEKELLSEHGFVVTSRLSRRTMFRAFGEIWNNDLPVFVSTDAILQAVHVSYDNVLKEVERTVLAPRLNTLLTDLRLQVPILADRYSTETRMQQMLRDVDLYLTVAHILLGAPATPYFFENSGNVQVILNDIASASPRNLPLFAATERTMDFSQFIVRGHYTQDSLLGRYFRSMIWLGRTELMLLPPEGTLTVWPKEDIQRQAIDAMLIAEAVSGAGASSTVSGIDSLISFMVGEQDNVTLENLMEVRDEAGVTSPADLFDTALFTTFQSKLAEKAFAFQRINSQIIMTDPCDPTQVRPPSSFLLLGQRFVIDSFIMGGVVYDKILFNGNKIVRILPSTLDVLFALGNDASAQILQSQLDLYKYGTNLAGLRYLVDAYDPSFWDASLFNSWLRMLRTLNPPADRGALPPFMQTAAWWQEKMNTQLASWAELRHDNLLYAKQSYTPGVICSYPESYVEPFPEFFDALKDFSSLAANRFGDLGLAGIASYYAGVTHTADTLASIARKELAGTPLLAEESQFLHSMLMIEAMCGSDYYGWYPRLYYGDSFSPNDPYVPTDFTIADVHTAPTDQFGNPVGWVMHAGTGPVDMAVVIETTPGGGACAFIGPVLSYYEYLATGFQRLTDEEWQSLYQIAPSLRPSFVNLYLADTNGLSLGIGPSLLTGAVPERVVSAPLTYLLSANYPNPFNPSTFVTLRVSGAPRGHRARLEVFDVEGRLVCRLFDGELNDGNYTMRWDGTSASGVAVSSGTYFCRMTGPGGMVTRQMVLLR